MDGSKAQDESGSPGFERPVEPTRRTVPGAAIGARAERPAPAAWWPIAVILVAAAALRALAWGRTAALFDDGPIFIYTAEAMATGSWSAVLQHPYHPLYSAGIWLVGTLLGDYELAAVALAVASGTAAVGLLYLFLRDAFDARTGLIGAAILAVHPRAVEFTSDVLSDSLYMALFLGTIWLIWRSLEAPSVARAAAAGALAGAAYLTRPEGVGLAAVAAATGGGMVVARLWAVRRGLVWGAALMGGLAIVAAPYVGVLRVETGQWMLSQKKSVGDLASFTRHDPGRAAEELASRPGVAQPAEGDVARTTAQRADTRVPIPTPSALPRATDRPPPPPDQAPLERAAGVLRIAVGAAFSSFRYDVLILTLLGVWSCRGSPGRRGLLIGATAALYGVLLLALAANAGYVSRRHALTPFLPALGYAAVGVPILGEALLALWRRVSGRSRGGAGGTFRGAATGPPGNAAAGLGLALIVALALPSDLAARREDRLAVRRAAEWLRDRDASPGGVAAGRLRIAYYAGGRFVPLPSAPPETMIGYLRGRGARYVIVDEAKVDQHAGLRAAESAGLRLLHRVEAAGRSAAVFEVVDLALPPQ